MSTSAIVAQLKARVTQPRMPTTAARMLGPPVGLQVVMVQEYAEAGPLQQGDAPMGESLAQYYFRQMVDGLAYLHGAAVVHGDMKPDNVLLSGTGLVKIADFGQVGRARVGGWVGVVSGCGCVGGRGFCTG